MTARSADSQNGRRGIQSIEVGFRLIRVLEREDRKLPLKLLAAEAGMLPSKAHLYLASFLRLGLVVQDPVTARYVLGPYAIQLGLAGIRQLSVVDVSRGPMEILQDTVGQSVFLSIWGNLGPTIIMKLDGALQLPMMIRVGFVLPVLASATGKVFLSHLPEREWRDVVDREAAARPVRLPPVLESLPTVRRQGVAVSDSQMNEGFAAVSAPVLDHDGRIAAAITLLGLRSAMDLDPDGRMARGAKLAAARASQSLGAANGNPNAPAEKQPKEDVS